MLEVVVGVIAAGGMAFAGVQAVNLGKEIQRDKLDGAGNALKRAFGETVNEPVPDDMRDMLKKLGGNGNGSSAT